MRRLWIDGYNLIGASPKLSLASASKDEDLINWLTSLSGISQYSVTVVFDNKRPDSYQSREKMGDITIIRACPTETADCWLIQQIDKLPRNHDVTIVTSDRDIIYRAKKKKCHCVKSENFPKWLKSGGGDDDDADTPQQSEREINYWESKMKPNGQSE